MTHQTESESPQRAAEAEILAGVAMHDLLAVLSPVLDWYQGDECPQRNPLEILRYIVADLQSDRAAALAGVADKRRLDWLEKTQTSVGYNVEACAWGVDFEAPYAPTIREAVDAGILSAKRGGQPMSGESTPSEQRASVAVHRFLVCSEWRCRWRGPESEVLRAPDPFNAGATLIACPECREQTLHICCDEPGCTMEATCGTPTADGYRRTCGKHQPMSDAAAKPKRTL